MDAAAGEEPGPAVAVAAAAPKHHFSFGVAVCFSINYIIGKISVILIADVAYESTHRFTLDICAGSGFLTLPWAFQQTGKQ